MSDCPKKIETLEEFWEECRRLGLMLPADQAPEPVAWRKVDPIEVPPWHGSWNGMREPQTLYRDEQEAGFIVEYAYLAPPDAPFKAAVLDALTINWGLLSEHETNARLAVSDLIAVETKIALDPAVSSDAQALIDKGRAEERERCAKGIESYIDADTRIDVSRLLKDIAVYIREMGDE